MVKVSREELKNLIEEASFVFESPSGWLCAFRGRYNLSQKDLGKWLSVSTPRIIAWERGLRRPCPLVIEGIISILCDDNIYLTDFQKDKIGGG